MNNTSMPWTKSKPNSYVAELHLTFEEDPSLRLTINRPELTERDQERKPIIRYYATLYKRDENGMVGAIWRNPKILACSDEGAFQLALSGIRDNFLAVQKDAETLCNISLRRADRLKEQLATPTGQSQSG